MNPAQLSIHGVTLHFKGLKVLDNVSFEVQPGSLHAIIGPNGAGKSSLINCISGFYRPQEGQILLDGINLVGMHPHQIVRQGLARTFQNVALFDTMTVLDNLLIGRHIHMRGNVLTGGLFYGPAVREEAKHRRRVEEVIAEFGLSEYRHQVVKNLPYGTRKRVELARAMVMDPKLLLLDEPVVGMTLSEKEEMVSFILQLREKTNITTVLIEHDMSIVMGISDRISVINFGQLIAEGTADEIQKHPEVIRAYLGEVDTTGDRPVSRSIG